MALASNNVLLVDPYADQAILQTYAIQAPESVRIRVLSDQAGVKPTLAPAATAWKTQFPNSRDLEVRLTAPKKLHDRLILVDDRDAYVLGQSFNALAARSPSSIVRADAETSAMKIAAFADYWGNATPF